MRGSWIPTPSNGNRGRNPISCNGNRGKHTTSSYGNGGWHTTSSNGNRGKHTTSSYGNGGWHAKSSQGQPTNHGLSLAPHNIWPPGYTTSSMTSTEEYVSTLSHKVCYISVYTLFTGYQFSSAPILYIYFSWKEIFFVILLSLLQRTFACHQFTIS